MLTVLMIDRQGFEGLSDHENLQDALDQGIYLLWMEDGGQGYPTYLVRDEETGRTLAVVTRDARDHEIALTWVPGESAAAHRCTYNADQDGRYLETVVRDCLHGTVRYLKDTPLATV